MRERIEAGLADLRQARAESLAPLTVTERVELLDAIGRRLEEALAGNERCPLAQSLQALLAREPVAEGTRAGIQAFATSLRRDTLWALLQEELGDPRVLDEFRPRATGGWHRATAPEVTACFLAGNTPLLAWPPLA
ncbi:MAG TPA: acyl-CoA reductase, partial [Armatimonadota bacterium]|nr:acyl-CoA reductase [Armatimonadota bacterium]